MAISLVSKKYTADICLSALNQNAHNKIEAMINRHFKSPHHTVFIEKHTVMVPKEFTKITIERNPKSGSEQ